MVPVVSVGCSPSSSHSACPQVAPDDGSIFRFLESVEACAAPNLPPHQWLRICDSIYHVAATVVSAACWAAPRVMSSMSFSSGMSGKEATKASVDSPQQTMLKDLQHRADTLHHGLLHIGRTRHTPGARSGEPRFAIGPGQEAWNRSRRIVSLAIDVSGGLVGDAELEELRSGKSGAAITEDEHMRLKELAARSAPFKSQSRLS